MSVFYSHAKKKLREQPIVHDWEHFSSANCVGSSTSSLAIGCNRFCCCFVSLLFAVPSLEFICVYVGKYATAAFAWVECVHVCASMKTICIELLCYMIYWVSLRERQSYYLPHTNRSTQGSQHRMCLLTVRLTEHKENVRLRAREC